MAEEKKFKLSEELEGLVQNYTGADALHKASRVNPNLDNTQLREQAERFYGDRMMTEYSPSSLVRTLKGGRELNLRTLDSRLDEKTFGEAREAFTKGLDEDVKASMYWDLLAGGIMPQAPAEGAEDKVKEDYKVLQFVKGTVDFVEALEIAAAKGDIQAGLAEIARYAKATGRKKDEVFTQSDMDYLTVQSKYGSPAARDNEKSLLARIAGIHRAQASALLKAKNLYGLIESSVSNTQYGKAIALNAMYESQAEQTAKNEEKAKKEAKK